MADAASNALPPLRLRRRRRERVSGEPAIEANPRLQRQRGDAGDPAAGPSPRGAAAQSEVRCCPAGQEHGGGDRHDELAGGVTRWWKDTGLGASAVGWSASSARRAPRPPRRARRRRRHAHHPRRAGLLLPPPRARLLRRGESFPGDDRGASDGHPWRGSDCCAPWAEDEVERPAPRRATRSPHPPPHPPRRGVVRRARLRAVPPPLPRRDTCPFRFFAGGYSDPPAKTASPRRASARRRAPEHPPRLPPRAGPACQQKAARGRRRVGPPVTALQRCVPYPPEFQVDGGALRGQAAAAACTVAIAN
ncbi:unnamed protein product [Urochloa humidicola]